MTQITEKIFVDSAQVISIVENSNEQPYGMNIMGPPNPGSIITLINGHSIFVSRMTPQEVYKKLELVDFEAYK